MGETETVVETVKSWIGNPISRGILKYIYNGNPESFNRILKKYAEVDVKLSLNENLKYQIVKTILNIGARSFGLREEELKKSMKNPLIRRAISNILGGIAIYGIEKPQTTIAPFLIVWNYTRQCNLKCEHCYENANKKPDIDELSTTEAKMAIDQFAEAGVVAIAFSGGEPLMRKDFYEVSKYAYEREFYISIATNGTLIDYENALKLKD